LVSFTNEADLYDVYTMLLTVGKTEKVYHVYYGSGIPYNDTNVCLIKYCK